MNADPCNPRSSAPIRGQFSCLIAPSAPPYNRLGPRGTPSLPKEPPIKDKSPIDGPVKDKAKDKDKPPKDKGKEKVASVSPWPEVPSVARPQ